MKKTIALTAVLFVLLTACSDDTTSTTTTALNTGTGTDFSGLTAGFDPTAITFTASLRRFDACADVLSYFKAQALAQVGPYGLNGGGGFYPTPFLEESMAADGAEAPVGAAFDGSSPVTTMATAFREGLDFSGSNVQVAGVDEPDIIKTDGSRIVAIMNSTLSYFEVSGGTAHRLGTLALTGWNHRFFMNGTTAIVFAQGDGYAMPVDSVDARIAPYGGPSTLVFEVDLSDPENPTVRRTMQIDGTYLSARSVDGTARMVLTAYPNDLPFVYPSNPAAEDFALEANKQAIENSTIDDWLPHYTLIDGTDGEMIGSGLLIDCTGVHGPAEFAGFETLAVVDIDLADGLGTPGGSAVIAQGGTVYASTENLYVATNVWVPSTVWGMDVAREIEQNYSTAIHKFDITGESAQYIASGSVRGHLLNQFSMDEYDGFLRVATTDGPPWGFDDTSESFVTVLQERDGALQQVGQVGDMGSGEQIYSVRFIGPAAYVVTFRQVDPFYVVDLSDPEAPRVSGELKIPGYSGYLHPISESRILGIGQDADSDGRTSGAKATVFDVSDPANPRELGSWTMPGGYSDIEWDHLAFLFWPPEEIAVIPIQNWQENFYGAVVLKTDDGVREFGRISHDSTGGVEAPTSDCRQLTEDELLAIDPSSGPDPGVFVYVCGEGQDVQPGTTNACESLPYDDILALAAEDGIDVTSFMAEGERLTVCYPEVYDPGYTPPIQRSLVIGDQIWTLSYEALQSNSVDDLSVGQYLPLG